MDPNPTPKPNFLDAIGKLCYEGKEIAAYLYQVPDDQAQRQRVREVLDAILKEASPTKHRELPRIADELRRSLDEPPSIAGADLLQSGFEQMIKIWMGGRSGLF